MSNHTPGPWSAIEAGPREVRLKRDHWEIGSSTTRRGVAYVFGDSDANAKLIAAAPELLEALGNLWAASEGTSDAEITARLQARLLIARITCESVPSSK